MPENMAERIKYLRKTKGLTLEDIASKVGVGKSTVRKWETGMIANMRRDKIASLADALGTTPEYLMGWTNEDSPDELVLTEGEMDLIKLFRLIPEDQQRVFLEMGRVFASNLKKD